MSPAYYVRRPLGGKGAQPCTIRMQSLAGRASSNTADLSYHGPQVRRNPRERLGTEAEPHSLHLLGKKRLRGAERSQSGGGIHGMSGGACHHTSHISAFRGGGAYPVRKARTRRGESCTSDLSYTFAPYSLVVSSSKRECIPTKIFPGPASRYVRQCRASHQY